MLSSSCYRIQNIFPLSLSLAVASAATLTCGIMRESTPNTLNNTAKKKIILISEFLIPSTIAISYALSGMNLTSNLQCLNLAGKVSILNSKIGLISFLSYLDLENLIHSLDEQLIENNNVNLNLLLEHSLNYLSLNTKKDNFSYIFLASMINSLITGIFSYLNR